MRIIVTCMKNEGPFLLEWVAYHLSIGFDKFLVYSNDCDDLTDEILDRLAALDLCEHLENPRIGSQRPQAVAMRDMFKQKIVNEAEWVMFTDCDEFLNIHLGDGHLDDLFAAMGEAEVISPMWRLFGDAGISDFADVPVIEQFLKAAPDTHPICVNAWGFKSLFRPSENMERIGAHRPFYKDQEAIAGKWMSSRGVAVGPDMINQGWRYKRGTGGYEWVQLNHYAIRSVDSFLVKCDRGHVLHTNKQIDVNYYRSMNHNTVEETSILRRKGPFHAALAGLMADPQLADLHARSVAYHKTKAIRLRDDMHELYQTLTDRSDEK